MEATCLVEFTPSGSLNINHTALCFLKAVQQPLQIVSIFGPKGTGKSYLMNRIAGIPKGFPLSLPGCPHVEGMWMLCLPHPSLNEHHLVLLDVRGFDPKKGDKRKETTLFILAVLLSNVFIYNTLGEFTQEELQKLTHITELPHLVKAASNENPYISFLSDHLPHFIWCVRDTALRLKMEETMTVENCIDDLLNAKNGAEDSPVGLINRLFPRTTLFKICEPYPNIRNLNPELIPDTQLRFIFKRQIQTLRQFIFDTGPKSIRDGRNVNGQILASLVVSYTNKLSLGDVIVLKEVSGKLTTDEERKHLDHPNHHFQISTFNNKEAPAYALVPPKQAGAGPSHWETENQRTEELSFMESFCHSSKVGNLTSTSFAAISMEQPICLIVSDKSGELQVNQEALKILLEVQYPVVSVAVVGLYRTGKSYLMNRLAGKQKGFSLGSTVESHTKGVWMWCVPHPLKHDHTLVLLDTEGLGDVEKGDNRHDCWIFALAVLLSSTLIYNSMGTIDQNALDKLHYITELTEHIKVKSSLNKESDSCHFARFFPAFIWAVRDFSLKLKRNNQTITEDDYLEHALRLQPGFSKRVQDYNFPRECIRNYFPGRKCFVFERPASKTEELQNLEELTENSLEPSFVKQVQKFCQHVFETSNAKTIQGGHILTGRLLGTLAVTYVDAIRTGTIPCLENAVHLLSQTENSIVVKQAIEHYEIKMKKCMVLPTETIVNFLELHAVCEKEAIQMFMRQSFKDDERKYQRQLMHMIKQSFERFHQKNEQESTDRCTAVILSVSQELEERIAEGYYFRSGGYRCFRKDLMDIIEEYKTFPGKGIKADEVLTVFMQEKKIISRAILHYDAACTEKEKQIEDERLKVEAVELEKIAMEKKCAYVQQMVHDQKRGYEENVRQLKIKLEEEREYLLEEVERALYQKEKEQKALLKDELQEKVKKLEAQIQALQQEKKKAKSPAFLSRAIGALGCIAPLVLPNPTGKIIGVVAKLLSDFV